MSFFLSHSDYRFLGGLLGRGKFTTLLTKPDADSSVVDREGNALQASPRKLLPIGPKSAASMTFSTESVRRNGAECCSWSAHSQR